MWIFIDCYDSFSYSLVDLLRRFHDQIEVLRYDDSDILGKIKCLDPERIILSPGPGHPNDYKIIFKIVDQFKVIPILGICLGHQIISEYFGQVCLPSGYPLHGKTSRLIKTQDNHPMFYNIREKDMYIMHYHSLITHISEGIRDLRVLAHDEKGQVMMFEHNKWPLMGIQFHPESILTVCGEQLIRNWFSYYRNL